MNINTSNPGISQAAAVRQTASVGKAYGVSTAQPAQPQAKADRVELTQTTEMDRLMALAKGADVRQDKVAAMKAAIADGSYDVESKLDTVADRMLQSFGE